MKLVSEDKRYKALCRFSKKDLQQMKDIDVINCYDDKANCEFVPYKQQWVDGENPTKTPQFIDVFGRYDFGKNEPIVYRGHFPDEPDIYFARRDDGFVEIVDMAKLAEMLRSHTLKVKKRKTVEWSVFLFIAAVLMFAILYVSNKVANNNDESGNIFAPFRIEMQTIRSNEYNSIQSLYKEVSESVVLIEIYSQDIVGYGTATGMIISEDGYLISCDHIYEGWSNPKFKVVLGDGSVYQAVFVAADKESDISIFKIVETPITFKPVVFGNSDDIAFGEECVVMGYPGGSTINPIVTSGLISAPKIQINGNTGYVNEYIQTDATANPGSSGGGLFNMSGQVIGLVTSKYTATNYENTTYSIGSKQIVNVVNQLLEDGSVTRISLGITFQMVTNNDIDSGLPYGCKIVSINENSAASSFAKPGQIIVECNGIELTRAISIYDILFDEELNSTHLTVRIYDPENQSYFFVEFEAKTREGTNSYITK